MAENNIDQKIQSVVGETIEDAIENKEPVEIEIVTEETIVNDEPIEVDFYANLSEEMDDSELGRISSDLMGDYENDKSSREEWSRTYVQGLDLLGFKYDDRTRPFRGASGVTHPLLAEAATQFSATAFKEMMPSDGPVRTRVVGKESVEVYQQAQRVKEFMNYQITQVMEEYTPELDQMLFYLPLSGSTFKKVYYDAQLGRAVSKFVPAEDLIVPYTASDLDSCERITHVVKQSDNDIRKKQVNGFYRDIELSPTTENPTYNSANIKGKIDQIDGIQQTGESMMVTLLEFHVDLDLEGFENQKDGEETGIKLPYIVTLDEQSGKILAIRRNYTEGDELFKKQQYFVHFKFLPGLGFYGFGLIHLIGGLSRTATQALRQLIDAGTLANLPAGFKTRGLRIKDSDEPLQPGEFRDVDAPSGAIREGLMPLPYKEPSQTLFALLGFVVQAGQRFAQVADMQVGDANQGAPVGTTIALLERGSRIMSSIHKRMYYAMQQEFKLLASVIQTCLPEEYPYNVVGGERSIKQTDFDERVDIIPIADPNIFSMAQRIQLAQTQLQLATSAPQLHNVKEAYIRMYEALGVHDIDKIMKLEKPEPMSPSMENQKLIEEDKIEAYEGQNHDAHIQAHLVLGLSPIVQLMPQIGIELNKHILQHVTIKAKEAVAMQIEQAEQQMGQVAEGGNLEAMTESQIATLEAQFLQEVQQLQSQMSGEGEPDPVIQLKQQELQQRAMNDQAKLQYDQQRLGFEQTKLQQKDSIDNARIDSQEDIAQLRANINLKKLDAQGKGPGFQYKKNGSGK
jgi:hypothetical protein|tara:strand:+ start:174 stop:2561 length:2388 start_codon:yes stop_codon:yes gene_type:complete